MHDSLDTASTLKAFSQQGFLRCALCLVRPVLANVHCTCMQGTLHRQCQKTSGDIFQCTGDDLGVKRPFFGGSRTSPFPFCSPCNKIHNSVALSTKCAEQENFKDPNSSYIAPPPPDDQSRLDRHTHPRFGLMCVLGLRKSWICA